MQDDQLKLVFATNNKHKLREIKAILADTIEVCSLDDIGCADDLPETSATIEGNAIQKAKYVSEKFGVNCFADDTGLLVDALDGRPGVYSARFAGLNCSYDDNVVKLLTEMKGIENRKAKFKTVIAFVMGAEQKCFEGVIEGVITKEKRGLAGFGYDPVFLPLGSEQTFAEMSEEEKNHISHRKKAMMKLVQYLKTKMASTSG